MSTVEVLLRTSKPWQQPEAAALALLSARRRLTQSAPGHAADPALALLGELAEELFPTPKVRIR
jgi:hypothetical protein